MPAVDAQRLYDVIAATWPPRDTRRAGPWTIRNAGTGSGRISSRVSAATAETTVRDTDIPGAEAAMRALGQPSIFMIRQGEEALDGLLAARGYQIKDPVNLFVAPVETLTAAVPSLAAIENFPPLAITREIWAAGGIGSSRVDIMERAACRRTAMLGREGGRAAGAVYVAAHGDVAMLHALEILPGFRRRGLARLMTHGCANWAARQGCKWLSLVTTRDNTGANALYSSLGMEIVGQYHYRIHPEPAP